MADTAAQQLRRILLLIPRLADDREEHIDDIARELGTTPQQLLFDFTSMTKRFDVAGFVESVRIHVENARVSVTTSDFHRPMRLTMTELCALELGLAMLRLERPPADHPAIDRALERLRKTISTLPANDDHLDLRVASMSNAGSIEHLNSLREAAKSHRRVRIRYQASAASEVAEREINPYLVIHSEQMWYAVTLGADGALRHFRLDRISAVAMLDATFDADGTVADRVLRAGKAFASDTDRHMTVRYSPRIARWVAEREGATCDADGSLTLTHPVADDAWAVRHVLQYGPEAEVVGPEEMRELMREKLASLSGQ